MLPGRWRATALGAMIGSGLSTWLLLHVGLALVASAHGWPIADGVEGGGLDLGQWRRAFWPDEALLEPGAAASALILGGGGIVNIIRLAASLLRLDEGGQSLRAITWTLRARGFFVAWFLAPLVASLIVLVSDWLFWRQLAVPIVLLSAALVLPFGALDAKTITHPRGRWWWRPTWPGGLSLLLAVTFLVVARVIPAQLEGLTSGLAGTRFSWSAGLLAELVLAGPAMVAAAAVWAFRLRPSAPQVLAAVFRWRVVGPAIALEGWLNLLLIAIAIPLCSVYLYAAEALPPQVDAVAAAGQVLSPLDSRLSHLFAMLDRWAFLWLLALAVMRAAFGLMCAGRLAHLLGLEAGLREERM